MYEQAPNATGPRIEVFVGTPNRKVDTPFVQGHGYIPHGMCKVPSTYTTLARYIEQRETSEEATTYLLLCRFGDALHGKPLTRVILDATENNEGYRTSLLSNGVKYIFRSKMIFAAAGIHFYKGIFRVVPVKGRLGGECILNGRVTTNTIFF